jgi:hypothetical protein
VLQLQSVCSDFIFYFWTRMLVYRCVLCEIRFRQNILLRKAHNSPFLSFYFDPSILTVFSTKVLQLQSVCSNFISDFWTRMLVHRCVLCEICFRQNILISKGHHSPSVSFFLDPSILNVFSTKMLQLKSVYFKSFHLPQVWSEIPNLFSNMNWDPKTNKQR